MRLFTSFSVLYLTAATVFLCLGTANAQVIFVSPGATGNGTSWENATGNLHTALAASEAGDEIWISGGTYTPTSCSPCGFADRDMRFVLPKGVKMRGGFVGTETSLGDRLAPQANPDPTRNVVLSGQIEAGIDTTRSFTVLESIAPTPGTLIDLIQFRNGLANDTTRGSSNRGASGALIYVTSYDTLQKIDLGINSCFFEDSHANGYGGGIFIDADFNKQSAVIIDNGVFENNTANLGGGGLAISSSFGGLDQSEIKHSTFTSNTAGIEGGGGMLVRAAEGGQSRSTFINTDFYNNSTVEGDGGGLRLYGKGGNCSPNLDACTFDGNDARFGGGLNIDAGYGGFAQTQLSRCEFYSNESSNAGGAVYVSAVFAGQADYQFTQSIFDNNLSGESGGAILVNAIEGSSRPLYRDCRFSRNEATLYGGAVYNLGKSGVCSPTFINCIIADNTASSAGGVYCLGSEDGESSPTILNCVFEGNQAMVGGALYSNGNDATGTAEPFVANTVFYNNSADNGRTLRIIFGRPHLLNCYIDEADCASLNSGFGGEPICVGGNQFNTADVFDRTLSDYTFKALPSAPILNAGNDSILIANQVFADYVNNIRFRGTATDIGPNEHDAEPALWNVLLDTTSVSACEGSDISVSASIYPPFPSGEIDWIVGNDTLAQGSIYTINSASQSQSIEVTGSLLGESKSINLDVEVLPTISTSLSTDVANLPDSLCIDSTYQLSATINAVGATYLVEWFDENENFLSASETISLSPTSRTSLERKVVVAFDGNCLDVDSREEIFEFDVSNCRISGTQQSIDVKSLTAFPNPVHDILSLSGLPGNDQLSVTIFTSTGLKVYSGTMSASHTTLNINSLPQGLYTLIAHDEQTIFRVLIEKL